MSIKERRNPYNDGRVDNPLIFEGHSAAPVQEPMAWISQESAHRLKHGGNSKGAVPVHAKRSNTSKIPLYNAPPTAQREWVGLTDEEREQATGWSVEHIEQALKEKNT